MLWLLTIINLQVVMPKFMYYYALILALPLITNCQSNHDEAMGGAKKEQNPPPKPLELSPSEIRAQQDALTMGEVIGQFNQLKTKAVAYTRQTLDNFVEALLLKNFSTIGGGIVDPAVAKFKVSGASIEIEEAPGVWKKIETDIEDKRALFKWILNKNFNLSYHLFESGMPHMMGINVLEQAVAWDDLESVKYFYDVRVANSDSIRKLATNDKDSTPLAFARSVAMAQYLLDKGAERDFQVRNLTHDTNVPMSQLIYLEKTNAPQDVIDLVKNYKKK